ncbi:arginine--tRNA ligase [Sediminitomix flava]|uniref:Arginine--tRNA ligase n=1 Tax=Sediminitomix flava TaxID=379075 RepID=A0A315ZTN3_SEDFL|nr:arginine--tRNA ligase [Sediminitomix flava]PWJ38594.1 arginyl-tRNA synthetase [Sediminitomix flava]
MNLEQLICQGISEAFKGLYDADVASTDISLQPTKKEFEGALTFVTFPYGRISKQKPEETANAIGAYLKENNAAVADFNVVKGFLNLVISDKVWIEALDAMLKDSSFAQLESKGQNVMVEYSSPNTNKPLHLGHLRNNFLGYSLSNILSANGYDVIKANLVNDRGVHICKSMLAYQRFGNDEQPSAELKGDHLAGKYYVEFDKHCKKQIAELAIEKKSEYTSLANVEDPKSYKAELEKKGKDGELTDEEKVQIKDLKELMTFAEKNAPLLLEAQEMLRKWEAGDEEVVTLWTKMNNWVYEGFDQTYKLMGVSFDKMYKESNTYLLGKEVVEEGLEKGVFFKKEDGSVWIDLSEDGLDEKLVLRGDGTAVYMTQDMGTADLKYEDYKISKSVYVVGNEQDYHFKVLKLIMQKLGRSYADGIYHMSYGMVELPSGKMKSREGTVVDADDLIYGMIDIAEERTKESGKIDNFTEEEAKTLYRTLALGALKYYLLKVDPRRKMMFNPEESIDFQGDTGVYIQYNHAKISALLRRAELEGIAPSGFESLETLSQVEADLIQFLGKFKDKIAEAGRDYSPSVIANYVYDLSKLYSKFYAEMPIFNEEDSAKKSFRIGLSAMTQKTIKAALAMLGVESPERM